MKLSKLQKRVIEKKLDPAAKLAKALYLTIVVTGNKYIPIEAFRTLIKVLALMLDDINGARKRYLGHFQVSGIG
jgi:hypothetical protein